MISKCYLCPACDECLLAASGQGEVMALKKVTR